MQHVVYAQVYMTDMSGYEEMNRVWNSYFAGNRPPARAVVGVSRMPLDTPIQINAVAVTDATIARLVRPRGYAMQSAVAPAVRAGERVYVSGVLGRRADTNRIPDSADGQVELALDHLRMLVKPAGKRLTDLNIVTVYVTETLDVAVVEKRLKAELPGGFTVVRTSSLPLGANIEITAIAAPDLVVRSTPGSSLNAVVTNVYADSIDSAAVLKNDVQSTGTTVQPVRSPPASVTRYSIISVK
jgi:enamine deaminase RidA (YjgF/YER057c/UK114 family)